MDRARCHTAAASSNAVKQHAWRGTHKPQFGPEKLLRNSLRIFTEALVRICIQFWQMLSVRRGILSNFDQFCRSAEGTCPILTNFVGQKAELVQFWPILSVRRGNLFNFDLFCRSEGGTCPFSTNFFGQNGVWQASWHAGMAKVWQALGAPGSSNMAKLRPQTFV